MFKLFKKQTAVAPTVEAAVAELPVTKSKYPQVVQDIHNEFFTAGENILSEAKGLLSELEKKDVAKGKRLAALGFGKTREAVVAIETSRKLASTKQIADLVLLYQRKYPNNKFITEEQVKQICEKYSLVCGEISSYKGFVPESKLSIIENFKVDKSHGTVFYQFGYTVKTLEQWYESNSKEFVDRDVIGSNETQIRIESLKICAPLKDMELGSRQQVVGYKIQNIPDPVVLQPVNGGYLIVCAWGDEASDEIVVNQKMN